jgi:nucleoside-diphosphate-sugar epimerase
MGMALELPIDHHSAARNLPSVYRTAVVRLLPEDAALILEHTEPLWRTLAGERLFITGGTGFFGRWVLESLVYANARLNQKTWCTVLTRDARAFQAAMPALAAEQAITLHEGDLARYRFPDGEFSHILHMGTTTSEATFNNESPLAKFENIVAGTERTLQFAVTCGAGKFLLTSSGAIYGQQPPDVAYIPEDQRCAPPPEHTVSAIGHSKRAAEFLTAAYGEQHGFDVTIARCFSFVGKHLPLNVHYAIGNFIRDALAGGPINVRGDGTPQRSYLYAADLVVWLMTILCKGAPGRVYNVGSEEDVSIGELAQRVARLAPEAVEVRFGKQASAAQVTDRYVPSTQRAERELGLKPLVCLDEGIARTIRSL